MDRSGREEEVAIFTIAWSSFLLFKRPSESCPLCSFWSGAPGCFFQPRLSFPPPRSLLCRPSEAVFQSVTF